MSSKIFYCTKVVAYGILCIITKLEFFQHHFSKMGHGNTSCDPHLHLSHQATNAALPHAQRPPPGGYVQTPKPETCVVNQGGIRFSPHWTAVRGPENGTQLRVTKSRRCLEQLPRNLPVR